MKLISDSFISEIQTRIKKIETIMKAGNAEALLVASNANIYYASGRFFRGYVFISPGHEPIWFVVKPQVYDRESHVRFIRKPEEIPALLKDSGYPEFSNIALEENELSYSDLLRLKALFPDCGLVNASTILKRARMVKTEWELNEMKIDGLHHVKVYSEIKDCYKPGMTDLQLQIEIERRLRLEGALGISRVSGNLMEINLGSVISGENADNPGPYEFTMGGAGVNSALPVGANGSVILKGETVMIDMNGAFNGYQTDMTRVWSLGKTSDLALKAHDCSIKILRCLEKYAVPGTPVNNLYEKAIEIVDQENLREMFMGHKSQVSFIGHGVGIELNELPVITARSRDVLEVNMTLAIEPKFVIPQVGAVGVENTYIVRDFGLENITVYPELIEEL